MENKEEEMEPQEDKRKLHVFGRNVADIPCFRNSFLYGSGSGLAMALMAFMGTSRPQLSTHIGFGSFFCTTIGYWFYCRYNYSQTKFFYSQLKPAMRKQAIYEGTTIEEEALKKAESV